MSTPSTPRETPEARRPVRTEVENQLAEEGLKLDSITDPNDPRLPDVHRLLYKNLNPGEVDTLEDLRTYLQEALDGEAENPYLVRIISRVLEDGTEQVESAMLASDFTVGEEGSRKCFAGVAYGVTRSREREGGLIRALAGVTEEEIKERASDSGREYVGAFGEIHPGKERAWTGSLGGKFVCVEDAVEGVKQIPYFAPSLNIDDPQATPEREVAAFKPAAFTDKMSKDEFIGLLGTVKSDWYTPDVAVSPDRVFGRLFKEIRRAPGNNVLFLSPTEFETRRTQHQAQVALGSTEARGDVHVNVRRV